MNLEFGTTALNPPEKALSYGASLFGNELKLGTGAVFTIQIHQERNR